MSTESFVHGKKEEGERGPSDLAGLAAQGHFSQARRDLLCENRTAQLRALGLVF